jgi:wyosine [tRNA(Phe)-imidazoG37] synthetase (radical SAM superfamily)
VAVRKKDSGTGRKMICAEDIAFGPIVSRRLGQSLGVNTVLCKTCAYSCVYCQLGPTRGRSVSREAHYRPEQVADAVASALGRTRSKPDFVTFLGCGEPTLAANLGPCLESVKEGWPGRTALLTSGALFSRPDVRADAMGFDVVMPTVAAGDAGLFKRIHHPHPDVVFEEVVEGLREFSGQYEGRFLPEVMLVGGLNDTAEQLRGIGDVLDQIRADRVHVTAPVRAPAQSWVRPPSRDTVRLAMDILPRAADFTRPETLAVTEVVSIRVEELLGIASMHPLTEGQAVSALEDAGASNEEALGLLAGLVRSSKMVKTEYRGERFYRTRK